MATFDNIVVLDTLRIEHNRPRKCTCDPYNKKFTVDSVNREVTCECGIVVDPFEAMEYLARHYDRINEQHKAMHEQKREWLKEKPHSVLFKKLERSYRRGEMLPSCPICQQTFDFKDVTFFTNARFYRAMKAKEAAQKGGGEVQS
ncbi:hypothetical protein D3C75_825180 [compost metagenome]